MVLISCDLCGGFDWGRDVGESVAARRQGAQLIASVTLDEQLDVVSNRCRLVRRRAFDHAAPNILARQLRTELGDQSRLQAF
jgi:hypothetical protein